MYVETKRDGESQTTPNARLEPWRQHLLIGADELERRGHAKRSRFLA
jgi:hypothetical protein